MFLCLEINQILSHLSESSRSTLFIYTVESLEHIGYLLSKLSFVIEDHSVSTRSFTLDEFCHTLIAANGKAGKLCTEHINDLHGEIKST